MTPEQINLIQQNFERIAPQAEAVATAFYNRLFAMQPVLRLLFPADLGGQKQKLMTTLAMAIRSLNESEKLIPVLENLGRRHALYGVRDEYYETVGTALLETLREKLGGEFTFEAHTAWAEMYSFLAATMKGAAQEMARLTEKPAINSEKGGKRSLLIEIA
jgi:hemoglobin-like flavoprotein